MNSVIKVFDEFILDLILVRAIKFVYGEGERGTMFVYFLQHDSPIDVECEYSDYLNLYTKWRNYSQWKLDYVMSFNGE